MIIYIIFVMVALVLIIVLPVPCLAFTAVGFVVPYRISTASKSRLLRELHRFVKDARLDWEMCANQPWR